MEIRNSFDVEAPPDRVYDALVDLERVGPAIPGATVGPAGADGTHPARIVVRLGPMRMTYTGTVSIVERDDAMRRAVLSADVADSRGQGTARATMEMSVNGDGGAARVESRTDVQLTGRAASMGSALIEDVAARLVGQMAANLSSRLASDQPTEPDAASPAPSPTPAVNGLALLIRVLRARIVRLLKRTR